MVAVAADETAVAAEVLAVAADAAAALADVAALDALVAAELADASVFVCKEDSETHVPVLVSVSVIDPMSRTRPDAT